MLTLVTKKRIFVALVSIAFVGLWNFSVASAQNLKQGAAKQSAAKQGAEAELKYVDRLVENGLFSTAAGFCETQQKLNKNSRDRIQWLLKLADVRRQEAWLSASGGGRGGLLGLTIQEIDEVLKRQPDAAAQFRLQIRQLELAADAIRMSLQVGEGGRIFGRFQSSGATRPRLSPQAKSIQSALQSVQQGVERSESLQKRLEQVRKRLGLNVSRTIREPLLVVAAEFSVLKYRILVTTTAQTQAEYQDAEQRIRESTSSVKSPKRRQHLNWLLAELSLWSGQIQSTDLLIGAAVSRKENQQRAVEPLSVRRHLFQRDTAAARTVLKSWQPISEINLQQKQWLLLECDLGDFELADQLDDQILKKSQNDRIWQTWRQGAFVGVAADAAAQTLAWFQLIQQMGRTTAIEWESIDQNDDPNQALQQLQAFLNRLPANQQKSIALLSLKAGRLSIDLKKWSVAERYLNKAITGFDTQTDQTQQSDADLLRLFAIAQQARTQNTPKLSQQYEEGLKNHIQRFGNQTSAKTARRWLAQIQKQTDPLAATTALLNAATVHPELHITDLNDAADLLIRHSAAKRGVQEQATPSLAKIQTLIATCLQSEADLTAPQRNRLLADSLLLTACRSAPDDPIWLTLRSRLKQLRSTVTGDEKETQFRCQILSAVVIANTLSPTAERQEIQQSLTQMTSENRVWAMPLLVVQATDGQGHKNRQWLAGVLTPLIETQFQQTQDFATQLQQLSILKRLGSMAKQSVVFERALLQLLSQDLSATHKHQLSKFMTDQRNHPIQQAKFWRDVETTEKRGSDLWLEAQLQLALLAIKNDRPAQAMKRLRFVDAIYETWGSEDRKRRSRQALKAAQE